MLSGKGTCLTQKIWLLVDKILIHQKGKDKIYYKEVRTMIGGYYGKVLRVDLSSKKTWDEPLSDDVCQKVVGGSGYGAKVLYEEVGPEVDPLAPGNRIIFGLGPLNGSRIPGGGKLNVITKSPLTGIQVDTCTGGRFAAELKKTGYDAVVIQGKSDNPVYLFIDNGKTSINDASSLWGKGSYQVTDILVDEIGSPKVSVAAIGPAGEKMLEIACLVTDKHSFAGRGGLGAVMGSKNLKAIVARGDQKPKLADPEKVNELNKENRKKIAKNAAFFRDHGTPGVVVDSEAAGVVPIKNWAGDTWKEGAAKIGGPRFTEYLKIKPLACTDCPIGCHRQAPPKDPQSSTLWFAQGGAAPEYETLALLGASCMVDDLDAICLANDICNRQGIDTIAAGSFIAFAMECFEKGLISKEQIGMELKWGDADAMVEATRQIAQKEGYLGEIFSQGIVQAAQKIGGNSIKFAQHVRNMDIPAHDPRAWYTMAINYATGTRGACHERAFVEGTEAGMVLFPEVGISEVPTRDTMEGKEIITAKVQNIYALFNSLVQCNFILFGGYTLPDMLEYFNAVTGLNWSMEQLMAAGERVFQLQRALNVLYGSDKKDDVLPDRMFEAAKEGGRANMAPIGLEDSLKKYYSFRGWDKNGRPTKDKLTQLGLTDTVKGLS